MKTIRTTIVSAIYRRIGSCFGLFDIAGQTQYMYNVDKYKISALATTSIKHYLVLCDLNFVFLLSAFNIN
jgi:hypothetical protein